MTHRNIAEAEDRKARSIEILKSANIPYIDHLPVIETEAQSIRREEDEVVKRLIAVAITAARASEPDGYNLAKKMTKYYNAEHFFTSEETEFLADTLPDMQDRVKFSWRYEIAWVMLWAIGVIDTLNHHDEPINVGRMADIMQSEGSKGLFEKATLRPQADILDAADLVYRQHWAFQNQSLTASDDKPNIELLLAEARHYGFNWLIGYENQSWDEITTDT